MDFCGCCVMKLGNDSNDVTTWTICMKVVYNHFYISFKKQKHLKHTKTLQFMRANFLNCEKGIRFGLQARDQIKFCLFF